MGLYMPPSVELLNRTNFKEVEAYYLRYVSGLQTYLTEKNTGLTIKETRIVPDGVLFVTEGLCSIQVSKLKRMQVDILHALNIDNLEILTPIPGTSVIGFKHYTKQRNVFCLRDAFSRRNDKDLTIPLGIDMYGNTVNIDFLQEPHLLISGTTGSGKSNLIDGIIMNIIMRFHPDTIKLILIDTRIIQLSVYNGIPHQLIPTITDGKKADAAINWLFSEAQNRFDILARAGARDIESFNKRNQDKMKHIFCIIDDYADIMNSLSFSPDDFSDLLRNARIVGFHFIISTQRPSVDIISGIIKADIPSRISFRVTSGRDSRIILDETGAENLYYIGEFLYKKPTEEKMIKAQSFRVDKEEIEGVANYLKILEYTEDNDCATKENSDTDSVNSTEEGELYALAGRFVIESNKASIGNLQRRFKIGFNKATKIMNQLIEDGVVSSSNGTDPRQILMSMSQFDAFLDKYT